MLTDSGDREEFYQYIESISFDISIGDDGVLSPSDQQ